MRPENRGRGECRVRDAPAASRANKIKHTSVVTTVAPGSPGIPARNGFTAYIVLSPVSEFVLSPSSADMACLSPVGPTRLREFNTSNGCQNHTALPYANSAVRQRAVDRSRDPALRYVTRPTLSRPPHPAPRP